MPPRSTPPGRSKSRRILSPAKYTRRTLMAWFSLAEGSSNPHRLRLGEHERFWSQLLDGSGVQPDQSCDLSVRVDQRTRGRPSAAAKSGSLKARGCSRVCGLLFMLPHPSLFRVFGASSLERSERQARKVCSENFSARRRFTQLLHLS